MHFRQENSLQKTNQQATLAAQLKSSGVIHHPTFVHGTSVKQSEPHRQRAMDCTAAILKACARSRSKWCRHERSSVRPWRPAVGCCCGRGVTAPGVVGEASSLLRRLLIYVCCCRSSEESSELCREWVDRPVGGRGGSEDEGER